MSRGGHGGAPPRGQDPAAALAPGGRFAKLFPLADPCAADDTAIIALFEVMQARKNLSGFNRFVPAGFTYLAQFVDHDITFDPLSKLAQRNDPRALVNFRTPRLDLDSVYGSGPRDQPFLYEWRSHTAAVAELLVDGGGAGGKGDLPRSAHDRAIIGDARNDEHFIITQLHLLFLRFHNAVVAHLREEGQVAETELFEHAQQLVLWHYQWIVTHEFLTAIVDPPLLDSVLEQHPAPGAAPRVHLTRYRPGDQPFVPLEFSGAAYRFGHSMVREFYKLTADEPGRFLFPDLVGFRPLPSDCVLEWDQFFDLGTDAAAPQGSHKIDPSIATPLFDLPDGQALPLLNLRRGIALELTSGQGAAAAMDLPALDAKHLLPDDARLSDEVAAVLTSSTPLWYYVLCEAAGQPPGSRGRLGPVGGRIVAEVLVGLLQGDPNSYLRVKPTWRPHGLPPDDGDFTMADLIRFADPRLSPLPRHT